MTFTPDSTRVSRLHPSPNIEPRRGGVRPSILLMHYTGIAKVESAIDWLSRPESKVSCHYVIAADGTITQMVEESMRAWHAGLSCWRGERDINSASIGIEIDNAGHEYGAPPFPAVQMQVVADLSAEIIARHGIRPERVLAHSDVAPQRKIDPGEVFDWPWLAQQGVGYWIAPEPIAGPASSEQDKALSQKDIVQFKQALADYGYDISQDGKLDLAERKVIAAFQRHFRPARVDGLIDVSTRVTLDRLNETLAGERVA